MIKYFNIIITETQSLVIHEYHRKEKKNDYCYAIALIKYIEKVAFFNENILISIKRRVYEK